MPHDPLMRDVLHDNQPGGLTAKDRETQKILMRTILRECQIHTNDPRIAYLALVNCLGSLLATQFDVKESGRLLAETTIKLPMYIEVYRSREKTIG